MERRNYNGDEFEAGDCGKGYNFTKGTADGILCSELEITGGSDEQYLDVSGAAINYLRLVWSLKMTKTKLKVLVQ